MGFEKDGGGGGEVAIGSGGRGCGCNVLSNLISRSLSQLR